MKLFSSLPSRAKGIIEFLEDSKNPFVYFIITFIAIVLLRYFLESFSDKHIFLMINFIHYSLFYICLALTVTVLFHLATKIEIARVSRPVLIGFAVILLAPLVDLILTSGQGYNMSYLLPRVHQGLILRYFTFGGDMPQMGITPGIRVEGALILIGCFIYFRIKRLSLVKTLGFVVAIYTAVFVYALSPYLVKELLQSIGLAYIKSSDQLMVPFFGLVILILGVILVYLNDKQTLRVLVKDIPPFRLSHSLLIFFGGVILGTKYTLFYLSQGNIHHFIFAPLSIVFAALFAAITNNIHDYQIDKVSNPQRPFAASMISLEAYQRLALLCLAAALFYASLVNFQIFFFVVLGMGNYCLYSLPPLRIKRIPFFSKLLISLNILILAMMGFILVTGSLKEFPPLFIALLLIGFTPAINFIDLKDYSGDKRAGIRTLPVILGMKRAQVLIGIFFALAYLGAAILLLFLTGKLYVLAIFLLLGAGQFYLVTKKDYQEPPVFTMYLISLALFLAYLIVS